MRILKILIVLISMVLFLNADDDHKKYKHSYKNLGYLQLERSQKEEIKGVLLSFKYKYKEFYKYKDEQEDILEDIIEENEFDEKLYYQTLMKIKERAAQLEVAKLKEIHKILDEEQREKFSDYLEEWQVE